MTKKIKSLEVETELFHDSLTEDIPNIVKRFQWARGQERAVGADNLYLWQNVLYYYREARNCYCCGLYFAAIQVIGSSIELGFKQIFLDYFPDLFNKIMKNYRLQNLKYYTEEVQSKGIISSELKEQIDQYRSKIRNLVAHPQPHMPLTLGGRELAPGSWVLENVKDLLTPEEAAKEGLSCMLLLCKEFDEWKRNHSKGE